MTTEQADPTVAEVTDHDGAECHEPERIENIRQVLGPIIGEGFSAMALAAIYRCKRDRPHCAFVAGLSREHINADDILSLMDGLREQADQLEGKLRGSRLSPAPDSLDLMTTLAYAAGALTRKHQPTPSQLDDDRKFAQRCLELARQLGGRINRGLDDKGRLTCGACGWTLGMGHAPGCRLGLQA